MKTNNLSIPRRKFLGATGAMTVMAAMPGFASFDPADKTMKLAERKRTELIDLLKELISIQSLSGETAEEAQKVVRNYLSKLPYRIEESADRPSRFEDHPEFMPPTPAGDGPFVNLVGWPEKGSARYAMFSHIDTHLVEKGWKTEPLDAQIIDNRMYGLGTSDDKGGVAAMLVAASILAESKKPLPVVMSLHGKGGGSRGSLPVFERISKSSNDIRSVLYVHPAETGRGLEDIKNAVLGIADLQLKVKGWRGAPMEIGSTDSASWNDGGNANDMCWSIMDHLKETVFKDVRINIGIMDGGDRIGSVADEAMVRFRLKFTGDFTWGQLVNDAEVAIQNFLKNQPSSNGKFEAILETVGYRTNPGEAEWDIEVSKILRNSITEITGRAPDSYPNHYAGDIRYPIRLLGVPAYGIGSVGGNFYSPNEWVDIDDLVRLVAVLVKTMSGWEKAQI